MPSTPRCRSRRSSRSAPACPGRGVRLAGYSGDAADLPRAAFQEILDAVAAGRLSFPVDRVYDGLEQVPQAHDDMEHDRATGKLVVRVRR